MTIHLKRKLSPRQSKHIDLMIHTHSASTFMLEPEINHAVCPCHEFFENRF